MHLLADEPCFFYIVFAGRVFVFTKEGLIVPSLGRNVDHVVLAVNENSPVLVDIICPWKPTSDPHNGNFVIHYLKIKKVKALNQTNVLTKTTGKRNTSEYAIVFLNVKFVKFVKGRK